jgi:pimeloyl-ACP methyl ester carboxylesterase
MTEPSSVELLPIVLVPGLACTPRLYAEQIPELWRIGPVTVAVHTRDSSIAAIAQRILSAAPPRFALAGLSMGGYIAFEMVRQAPARIAKLALLDTSARADAPEQGEQRRAQIELARRGRIGQITDELFSRLVHASRREDESLKRTVRLMAEDAGADAFVRQQTAIMGRIDSRPSLSSIRCPTLVVVGDGDELTPPERAAEIAQGIGRARLVTIAGSGHLSTLEQPRTVTQALATFLRE